MLPNKDGVFHIVPNLAAVLKNELEITNHQCIAYDILFGCPGWLQGVIQANRLIASREANTPNIDKLAHQETMFTNYHTSPSCAPSRAMLLTGYDSHLTGVPNLPLFSPPNQVGEPGYERVLNYSIKTVATQLKENGYSTYITGKWHLGHTEKTLLSKRGFNRSYILNASGADNYEHKAYLPP
jgi:arylsulfatase A-like enzyme